MPRREISSGGETIYMEVSMIRAKVREWVKRHGLLPQGGNVLAACSGGPDSLALVDLLFEYQETGDIRLFVAHFDHCLRGNASSRDAAFVRQFCAERGLEFFGGAADLSALLRVHGGSLEELARSERYRFLRGVVGEIGGGLIATGHHRDDQAETVLLNLVRGSGSRGLGAMKPLRADVTRPLLCLDRSEIEAYCRHRNLQPCSDASNADVDFLRNRMRHELLPVLKKWYNPAVVATLCRTAEILTDEQDFLRSQAMELLPRTVERFAWGCRIDADAFCRMHVAMQREFLRQLLEQLRGDTRGVGFVHVEQIRQLFLQENGARRIALPGGWQARKTYRELIIEQLRYGSANFEISFEGQSLQPVLLQCPGETTLPELGVAICCTRLAGGNPLPTDFGLDKVVFDCAALHFPLHVRRRLPGDVFYPLGAPGSRKLKKLLIDLKVPVDKRNCLPLICDEKGILWIAGLRRSERGKVAETSRELLVMELTRIDNT
jgi:tRNA(Ile)-lysidine synthase